MYSVSINNVSKQFGKTLVLKDLSLDIKKGEFFFLLGPSGCGKTTLLRILAGFDSPDSGSICFNENEVTSMPSQKRRCSMVFQNYALWPHMTVYENIAFGLENQKLPKPETEKRVSAVLKLVRMAGLEDRFPGQLSGGQQQRVALARAIVVNPELLLFDEPLSNLDAKLRHEMRSELLRLHQKTGITTLYVTHDQEEALSLADRIAYMEDGRIEQLGTPRELYANPRTLRTANFLGQTNVLAAKIVRKSKDQYEAETALGNLMATCDGRDNFSPGESVHLVFRPEKMAVGEGLSNTLHGTISSAMFNGGFEALEIECGNTVLRALVPTGITPAKTGEEFRGSIDPQNVRIIKNG